MSKVKLIYSVSLALTVFTIILLSIVRCQPAYAGEFWTINNYSRVVTINEQTIPRVPAIPVRQNTPQQTTHVDAVNYTFYNSVDVSYNHARTIYQRLDNDKNIINYLKKMGIVGYGQSYTDRNGVARVEFICFTGVKNCKTGEHSQELVNGGTVFVVGKDNTRQNIVQPINTYTYRAFAVKDVSIITTAAD